MLLMLPSDPCVAGLGYAETVDADKQVSWRSLLQRYLGRRESLRLVCHLVDARHQVTATDREVSSTME